MFTGVIPCLAATKSELPRCKQQGINRQPPNLNSFRGKPRGIEPEEIDKWNSDTAKDVVTVVNIDDSDYEQKVSSISITVVYENSMTSVA